nr:MAG: hypothetical protein [Wenzhou bat tapwovirus 1]
MLEDLPDSDEQRRLEQLYRVQQENKNILPHNRSRYNRWDWGPRSLLDRFLDDSIRRTQTWNPHPTEKTSGGDCRSRRSRSCPSRYRTKTGRRRRSPAGNDFRIRVHNRGRAGSSASTQEDEMLLLLSPQGNPCGVQESKYIAQGSSRAPNDIRRIREGLCRITKLRKIHSTPDLPTCPSPSPNSTTREPISASV